MNKVYTLPLPPLRRRLLRRLGAGWRAGFTRLYNARWIGAFYDEFTREDELRDGGLEALFGRPDISSLLLRRHAWRAYTPEELRRLAEVAPEKGVYLVAPEKHFLTTHPFVADIPAGLDDELRKVEAALGRAFGGWVWEMPPVKSDRIASAEGREYWLRSVLAYARAYRAQTHRVVVMLTNPWLLRPSILTRLREASLHVGVHLHPQMSGLFAQWRAWDFMRERDATYPLHIFWHQSAAFSQEPRPTGVVRRLLQREQLVLWIEKALGEGADVTLWIDDDAEGLAPMTLEAMYALLERRLTVQAMSGI